MRQFQKILIELKDIVARHQPGDTLPAPESMSHVEVHGRRMSYVTMGPSQTPEQPVIVFLHGFGGFFMDWPRVMIPVARHATVYAPDMPGWGFSELNTDARYLEDQISAVREFIVRLNLKRVIVCGVSYGAGVAWGLAALGCPGLERVVLMNAMPPHPLEFLISPIYQGVFALCNTRATALMSHRLMRKTQWKMLSRENLLNERLLDTVYLDISYLVIKQPKVPFLLNAIANGARETNWSEWEQQLAGLNLPCTIMQGLNDRVFSQAASLHLHELIPHSELIQVAECGHAMGFDQHKRVADYLIELAKRG